jgi:hypothetical protein
MSPEEILQKIYERALSDLNKTVVLNSIIRDRVDYVCRCMNNRAGARLLMSCR